MVLTRLRSWRTELAGVVSEAIQYRRSTGGDLRDRADEQPEETETETSESETSESETSELETSETEPEKNGRTKNLTNV